jgi:transposase
LWFDFSAKNNQQRGDGMNFKDIILQFLGLQDVIIEDIKIFRKDLRAVIKVRQDRGECFCRKCGLQFTGVHQWEFKKLKGPPMGIIGDVTIKVYQLRGYCDDCNTTGLSELSWLHPKFKSMTCGYAEVAGRLMEEITCEAVGRILGEHSKKMWDLDQWRMELMLTRLELPKNIDVTYLSADEVHFRTLRIEKRKGLWAKRWRPEFITNLVCYAEGKVLFNAMGRDSKALRDCLLVLSPGQKLAVEKFAVDMHDPFISVVKKDLPNAEVCVDRYHLAEQVNRAFDSVRRSEFKKARESKNEFIHDMLLPHRRFILVAREKDLSKAETKLLDKLRTVNKEIHTAMLLVEYFHSALDKTKIKSFRDALKTWYLVARESKLKPFLALAKTIRKYRRAIEAYIKSRLTTAVSEGLNNKIKTLKRMGYGYTNPTSFKRKILQRCGYLNHNYINTDDFFFKMPNQAF